MFVQTSVNIRNGRKRRIHGSPHQSGSLVWLFNPVVPRGGSRKFHKPWTGPYRVITRLLDNTYKIKAAQKPHRLKVVHFDRLKCCTPNVRIPETSHPHPRSPDVTPQPPVGTNVQVVDNNCEILDATVPVPPATSYDKYTRWRQNSLIYHKVWEINVSNWCVLLKYLIYGSEIIRS